MGYHPQAQGYPQQMYMQQPYHMQMQMQQPVFQQQSMMNPLAYSTMNGGWTGNANGFGMMGGTYASYAQNMGGMSEEQISGQQRSAIDRWRMGIGQ